jgi:ubiquinone/menaquinone biosynthesis C-methylase UbiE
MYTDFALVYDRLMQDVDYQGWADYYTALLSLAGLHDGAAVTECACGTGNLTLPLSARYRMTGLDLSQEMLSRAALKLKQAGRQVPLICQDMQQLKVHKPQDAILCTCDGINYLTGDKGLSRFLNAAFLALRLGGALAFDVSSVYKLSHVLGDKTLASAIGDSHYIWYNCWQPQTSLLNMQLHVYTRAPDSRFDYFVEDQRQRAYTTDSLTEALRDAGFEQIQIFGGLTFQTPCDEEERLHLLAIKPNDKDAA